MFLKDIQTCVLKVLYPHYHVCDLSKRLTPEGNDGMNISGKIVHHADSSLQWSCTAQEVFDGDIDGESSEESPRFTEGFDYLYPLSTQWVMESLTICHLIHLHHQHLPACLWLTIFFFATLMESENVLLKQKWKHLLKAMLHFIMLRRRCFHIAGSKWHNKAKRNVHLIHDALAVEDMNHTGLKKRHFYCDDNISYCSVLSKTFA